MTSSSPRRGRDSYARYRSVLGVAEGVVSLLPRWVAVRCLVALRRRRSLVARATRFAALRHVAAACGEMVDVREDVHLECPQRLTVGSRVSINPMTYIDATGGVTIGDDVSIAHAVTIMSTEHRTGAVDVPIRDQGLQSRPTVVGDDVWIGAGARLLAGVRIGSHSIVGAGAVVTRDVPAGSTAVGVPARSTARPVEQHG